MIEEAFAESGGTKIHYLRSGHAEHLAPLVYMPGLLADAETFRPEMTRLAPRLVVAAGRRGVGNSSAPTSGYGLLDQQADLAAVVEHANPPAFCGMAFSLGVPVMLRYATQNPQQTRGLILLDYPARYPQLPEAWARNALNAGGGTPQHVIRALQREAEKTSLWHRLEGIPLPTLIVRGGSEGSLLTGNDARRYLSALPNAREVVLENAGHEVYKPDYQKFLETIHEFLAELDDQDG